jgi:hypothetical protein
MYRHILEKLTNIKFHKNVFGSSGIISCIQTDRRTKRFLLRRNAKAPNKRCVGRRIIPSVCEQEITRELPRSFGTENSDQVIRKSASYSGGPNSNIDREDDYLD